jgi:hypothetical protein
MRGTILKKFIRQPVDESMNEFNEGRVWGFVWDNRRLLLGTWTVFIYLAFYIAPEEVVWFCTVRRAGGASDVHETRNESARKNCPEDLHGNFCCVSSCSIQRSPTICDASLCVI